MGGLWTRVSAKQPGSNRVNVVVETPGGSRSKFKYDEDLGLFRLHKLLPAGSVFPYDFGFVPGTKGEDGDPLDVMILGEKNEATFTGCIVSVRLLGVIQARQTEKRVTIRNDRLIGTAETPKIRPRERSLGDVPEALLKQIEHFFISYNEYEGRVFTPFGRRGPVAAAKLIEEGIQRFSRPEKGGRGHGRTTASR